MFLLSVQGLHICKRFVHFVSLSTNALYTLLSILCFNHDLLRLDSASSKNINDQSINIFGICLNFAFHFKFSGICFAHLLCVRVRTHGRTHCEFH